MKTTTKIRISLIVFGVFALIFALYLSYFSPSAELKKIGNDVVSKINAYHNKEGRYPDYIYIVMSQDELMRKTGAEVTYQEVDGKYFELRISKGNYRYRYASDEKKWSNSDSF